MKISYSRFVLLLWFFVCTVGSQLFWESVVYAVPSLSRFLVNTALAYVCSSVVLFMVWGIIND